MWDVSSPPKESFVIPWTVRIDVEYDAGDRLLSLGNTSGTFFTFMVDAIHEPLRPVESCTLDRRLIVEATSLEDWCSYTLKATWHIPNVAELE